MKDLHYLIGKPAAALLSGLLPWEFSAVKSTEIMSIRAASKTAAHYLAS